jgi:hypothetical protein
MFYEYLYCGKNNWEASKTAPNTARQEGGGFNSHQSETVTKRKQIQTQEGRHQGFGKLKKTYSLQAPKLQSRRNRRRRKQQNRQTEIDEG